MTMLRRTHIFSIYCLYLLTYAKSNLPAQEEFCSMSKVDCLSFKKSHSDFIGRYTFPTKPIETLECKSEEAVKRMENAVPVVLKNCHFGDITQGWTTDYLKENLISPNLTVYLSSSRRFLFYNDKIDRNYTWTPPHERREMNLSEFLNLIDELDKSGNGSKVYLQTDFQAEQLNSDIQDDILMFNTVWLQNLKKRLGWGQLDVNLFLIGMPSVVTPAHYDIMENLFLQIHGKKRCILFSPESYENLYPFPLHHPHDRQSQVNFDAPDFKKFPKFQNITGLDAVLQPGDVLYIPNYWWHYIESEENSKTISMNFWYLPEIVPEETSPNSEEINVKETSEHKENGQGPRNVTQEQEKEVDINNNGMIDEENEAGFVPLSAAELIGLSRQIEEMIGNAIADTTKVGQFLKTMTDGRYDYV